MEEATNLCLCVPAIQPSIANATWDNTVLIAASECPSGDRGDCSVRRVECCNSAYELSTTFDARLTRHIFREDRYATLARVTNSYDKILPR
jgi:hypothetical protein